jgi:hypothetical protein
MPYGTPFDLNDFKDTPDFPTTINYVKIIDVIGSIDHRWGTKDSYGKLINDPWPTNFASSGFDLDAVGVINQLQLNSNLKLNTFPLISFKNPQNANEPLVLNFAIYSFVGSVNPNPKTNSESITIQIRDAAGITVFSEKKAILDQIVLYPNLKPGLYFIQLNAENSIISESFKLLLQ